MRSAGTWTRSSREEHPWLSSSPQSRTSSRKPKGILVTQPMSSRNNSSTGADSSMASESPCWVKRVDGQEQFKTETTMWGSLKKRLFGGEKNSTSAVSRRSSRELDDDRFPRESRTVGQTEARL